MYGYVLYDTILYSDEDFHFLGAPEFRADEADYASVNITDSVRYVFN